MPEDAFKTSIGERLIGWMYWAVLVVEAVVAGVLVLLAIWGAVTLALGTYAGLTSGVATSASMTALIDAALTVFIVVELFRIAVAYMRHENVIPTVMEAAVVAVARKFVIFDVHAEPLDILLKAGGLALLMLSITVSWYLLAKRDPRLPASSAE